MDNLMRWFRDIDVTYLQVNENGTGWKHHRHSPYFQLNDKMQYSDGYATYLNCLKAGYKLIPYVKEDSIGAMDFYMKQ